MNKKKLINNINLYQNEESDEINEESDEINEEKKESDEINEEIDEINEEKKEKKEKKIQKKEKRILFVKKSNKISIIEGTREIKKIFSDYNYEIEKFIKKYMYQKQKYGLNDDEINNIIELYKNRNNQIEDDINLILDCMDKIPEKLYVYCENYLTRIDKKIEKIFT